MRAAVLEHHGPCLGYAVAEPAHFNVWKNRLAERGLTPGPWLQALKRAVAEGQDDDVLVDTPNGREPLAALRLLLSVTAGQKIAYVTDVADTPSNRARIPISRAAPTPSSSNSCFAAADAEQARARAHLTTRAAGEIARLAGARRLEPFHFSPRYEGEEERMLAEAEAAFRG